MEFERTNGFDWDRLCEIIAQHWNKFKIGAGNMNTMVMLNTCVCVCVERPVSD